jgi:predicted ATPase with chaperone activity
MTLSDIIKAVRQAAAEGRDLLISGPVNSGGDVAIATYYAALVGGPFRAPHHTVGNKGAQGEAELAEGGTLFLCDLPEFRTSALELAGQTRGRVVASANICPCGQHPTSECVCSEGQVTRFQVQAAKRVGLVVDNPVRIALKKRLTVQECEVIYSLRDDTGNWPSPVELQRMKDNQYPKTNGGRPC